MNPNPQPYKPLGVPLFDRNSGRFDREKLTPYLGQYVAWSADGTRVLAAAPSPEELDQKLAEQGIHFSEVVHDYADIL